MSNAQAGLDSCKQTALAIQSIVADNKVETERVAARRAAMDAELQDLKQQLKTYPQMPSRSVGDFPKKETGCIYSADVGSRHNQAVQRCREKGAGYEYTGGNWSCGGWNACCEFNHECAITQSYLDSRWNEWNAGKQHLETRIRNKQLDYDAIMPVYKDPPPFTCCTNVVQAIGSDISSTQINQMNECITQLEREVIPSNQKSSSSMKITDDIQTKTTEEEPTPPDEEKETKKTIWLVTAMVIAMFSMLAAIVMMSL